MMSGSYGGGGLKLNKNVTKISHVTEIVLIFVCFLFQNFSLYFVLVFWITIIRVLVILK